MAIVFWNFRGMVFIDYDYLVKGRTINGANYVSLLEGCKLKAKRQRLSKKQRIFHHDNATVHKSRVIAAKLHDLRFVVLPRFTPNDYVKAELDKSQCTEDKILKYLV